MTAASKTFRAKTDGCAKNALHLAHGVKYQRPSFGRNVCRQRSELRELHSGLESSAAGKVQRENGHADFVSKGIVGKDRHGHLGEC